MKVNCRSWTPGPYWFSFNLTSSRWLSAQVFPFDFWRKLSAANERPRSSARFPIGVAPALRFRVRAMQSRNDWVIHRYKNTTNTRGWERTGSALGPLGSTRLSPNYTLVWRHEQKAFRLKNARWLSRCVLPLIRRVQRAASVPGNSRARKRPECVQNAQIIYISLYMYHTCSIYVRKLVRRKSLHSRKCSLDLFKATTAC